MVETSLWWSFCLWLQLEIFKILNVEQEAVPRRNDLRSLGHLVPSWRHVFASHSHSKDWTKLQEHLIDDIDQWEEEIDVIPGFAWCIFHHFVRILWPEHTPSSQFLHRILDMKAEWNEREDTRGFSKKDGSLSKRTGFASLTWNLLKLSRLNISKHTSSNNPSKIHTSRNSHNEKNPTVSIYIPSNGKFQSGVVFSHLSTSLKKPNESQWLVRNEVCLLNSRHWSRTRGGGLGSLPQPWC